MSTDSEPAPGRRGPAKYRALKFLSALETVPAHPKGVRARARKKERYLLLTATGRSKYLCSMGTKTWEAALKPYSFGFGAILRSAMADELGDGDEMISLFTKLMNNGRQHLHRVGHAGMH